MAYSDYGGMAYRNGIKTEARCDCALSKDEGGIVSTPGAWPGWRACLEADKEKREKLLACPTHHVVLGDGPIFVGLHKQTSISVYRLTPDGFEDLPLLDLMVGAPEGAIREYRSGRRYIDTEAFSRADIPAVFSVEGHRIEVRWTEEDNYYQHVRLEQPNGTVWHGWSGYGVGCGLEDAGYGYNSDDRDEALLAFWPDAIKVAE